MNGPDATAGSIFIFLKIIGISVPTIELTVIAIKSDNPTMPAPLTASIKLNVSDTTPWFVIFKNKNTKPNDRIDSTKPLKNPILSSFLLPLKKITF